jgi:gliding motility-associated-like protein
MKRMFKGILTVFTATIFLTSSYAQLVIDPNGPITPAQAVQDILIGAGVQAFNVTFNGSAANANNATNSVREFNAGATAFPIQSGVLMQTQGAPTVNNDPDLTALAGQTVTNGVIIEFDFIPTGDTLSFNYIFASAEYTSYTCSNFNDVFGFFISGPGISGPFSNNAINIATVPGTNVPVAINTVNSGSPSGFNSPANCSSADPNWQANSIYFTTSYNTIFSNTSAVANFNGATVVLAANSDLVCNQVFHIKLAVANAVDTALDSGVFLEANSFTSPVVDINIQAGASVSDTTLVANCTEGVIYFTRPATQASDTLVIYFQTSGDAIEGSDYNFLAPGDSIVFLPGQDTITLTITPTNGGPSNNPLSLIVSAQTITACGDTIFAEGIIWLLLEPDFTTNATDTTILCQNDEVNIWGSVTGGFPPYTFEWDDGQTGSSNTVPVLGPNGNYYFVFTATDQCGFQVQDSALVVLNQILSIDTMFQFPSQCGLATGAVSGQGSGFTGTPNYNWTGPGPNNPNFINASVWQNLPSGWYYFTITDNVCSVNDSIFLEQDPPPTAAFTANPQVGNAPLNVTFVNNSQGASTYFWDFANGNDLTINNTSSQNQTYTEEGNYLVMLVATEGACSDTAYQVVVVNLILPLSFDMPNVFTPNGDGSNDVFTINPENAAELDMVILNRWGNVVYESNEVNMVWNGRNRNTGEPCSPGTYFYKFTITDLYGESQTHHGFVQLVRD